MVLWQVFCDGKTFLIAKKQSVTVLPALHFFTWADPRLLFDFFFFIFKKHTGTQLFAGLIYILSKSYDQKVRNFSIWM